MLCCALLCCDVVWWLAGLRGAAQIPCPQELSAAEDRAGSSHSVPPIVSPVHRCRYLTEQQEVLM